MGKAGMGKAGMGKTGTGLVVLLGLLTGAASAAMAECPCPKSKMVELYGTVSMFPPHLPGPRIYQPPVARTPIPVSTTAMLSTADVARSLPTPAIDRVANPLAWAPLFVQQ